MKQDSFAMYEWIKRVIESCENQGQCNTAERLLWLADLDFIYFVELREILYQKELSFIDGYQGVMIAKNKQIMSVSRARHKDPLHRELMRGVG